MILGDEEISDKVTNSDLDKISKCCISGDLVSLRTIWQLKVVQILGRTLAEKRERERNLLEFCSLGAAKSGRGHHKLFNSLQHKYRKYVVLLKGRLSV